MSEPLIDRIRGALVAIVEQIVAPFQLHALYPSTVKAQNEDGSLELQPDAKRFGLGLSRVPLRLGVPGVSAKVKQGARVLLGFEAGDERRPVATLWEADGLDELVITAATKVTVSAPKVVVAQKEGDARPVAVVGAIVQVSFVGGPPGAPNIGYGYVTEGVQTLQAGP